uniref:peptidylprolyl isomerase n=1 Tax=Davidia involucrata TaxID=16924 RepID=A0A5B7BEQ9_DAVIN
MAFWGIEVKPGIPYTHRFDNERGRLHVSQATLGDFSSEKKSIVQCNVGDKRPPIYLCSLLPERIETCPLNLEFEEDDEVTFSVIGPNSIHLSGFFLSESHDTCRDGYESDSYEDIAETESDESTDYDTEDEYEDDFIDDDLDMFPPSPVRNSGVVIEELVDEKPANANENGISKRPKKKNRLRATDDNDNSQQQIVVKSGAHVPVLESEDEDGFPISSPRKSKDDVLNTKGKAEEIKDKRIDEETKRKKAKDDPGHAKKLKRKVGAIVQDGEQERESGQPDDSSLATTQVAPENDVKQKKKKRNKKAGGKKEDGEAQETGIGSKNNGQLEETTTRDMNQALPVGKEHDEKLTTEKSLDIDADSTADENHSKEKKKKKKKEKSKKQETKANASVEQTVIDKDGSTMEIEEKTEAKPFQVRSFPNGLVIEELAMGKPDGKRASPGKKVSVHYIGKLKKNGKIFDSNVGRAPFKFRLGVGQVIKGWDVGVNGMRVGDKRRLTIPPAMGYGARGAGGAIPPNSWLAFDVELVDVR